MFNAIAHASLISDGVQINAAPTAQTIDCPIRARVAARMDATMNRLGGLGAALDFAAGFNQLNQDKRDALLNALCAHPMRGVVVHEVTTSSPLDYDGTKDPLPA